MYLTNIMGTGPVSEQLEVLFAEAPVAQAAAPAFVARSGGNSLLGLAPYITISWVPPLDDGGTPILGYIVEKAVLDSSGNAGTWSVIYDGSTAASVLEFKFQDGTALTAGLTYGFRTYSRNAKGPSPASASIAITAATIPGQLAAPTRTSVTIDPSTQATSVEIAWTTLGVAEAGGSPVTAYRLRKNEGYGTTVPDTDLGVAGAGTLSHTFTDLLIGVTYQIVIAAVNDVHTSNAFTQDNSTSLVYSEPLEITVANIPA
jgi:titin